MCSLPVVRGAGEPSWLLLLGSVSSSSEQAVRQVLLTESHWPDGQWAPVKHSTQTWSAGSQTEPPQSPSVTQPCWAAQVRVS